MKGGFLSLAERFALAWEGLCLWAEQSWTRAAPARTALCAHMARVKASPLRWGSLYVTVFCLISIIALDRPVAAFFKAQTHGETEGFFKTVTHLGEAQLYLVPGGVLTAVLALAGWRAASRQRRIWWWRLCIHPGFLVASMAISGIINNIIKTGIGRMRPRYWFDQGLYGMQPFNRDWGMNSFPSGHSQAAFAAMTALMVIFPRHAALWLTIALLVAASRVVTTVHWLSDVAGGSWLAIFVTIALARWFRQRGWEPDYSARPLK